MKLVEILARELEVWPVWAYELEQDHLGDVVGNNCAGEPEPLGEFQLADDHALAIVTKEDWQAERDRMSKMEALIEARDNPPSNEPTYEQQLWDRVAMESFKTYGLIEQAADHADAFMAERAKRVGK